jgi:hypothetical protein
MERAEHILTNGVSELRLILWRVPRLVGGVEGLPGGPHRDDASPHLAGLDDVGVLQADL